MTPKTCENLRQGDQQINRLKERTHKLENKIGDIFFLLHEAKKKLWVGWVA